jgi:magnesium transporter
METEDEKPPEKKEDDLAATEQQIGLQDEFIREIAQLLDEDYTDRIQELCRDLPAPDAAELIVKLDKTKRHKLVEVLEDDLHPETFSYFDRDLLNDLLEHMSGKNIAHIVNELDSDDAISLITNLDEERQGNIVRHLNRNLRAAVEEGLTFPEASAGRMMQREFVAVPQFWTVGKTVDYLRAAAATLPERFYNIFIVDPMHRFIGAVSLSHVLCAQRAVKIDTLVEDEQVTVPVMMDQEQVAFLFRRKDLLSAPVVDDDNQLIGVITVDDVVDVIEEEAQEDLLKMGGVSNSDIFRPPLSTVRARFWWLFINLGTAFIDTFVISLFDKTIEKIVVLAALMPVVASMGGNAGTQTLAVIVRAIATKDLTAANTWRTVIKELLVGSINGILFGIIMIIGVTVWYHNWKLGGIMAAAMIINLAAAGLSGALIPLALNKTGFDPAHGHGLPHHCYRRCGLRRLPWPRELALVILAVPVSYFTVRVKGMKKSFPSRLTCAKSFITPVCSGEMWNMRSGPSRASSSFGSLPIGCR